MVDTSQLDTKISFIPNASWRNTEDKWRAILYINYLGRQEEEATDYVFETYDQAMEYAKAYAELRLKHAKETLEHMKGAPYGNRT